VPSRCAPVKQQLKGFRQGSDIAATAQLQTSMTRLLAAFVLQHAVAAAAAKSSDLTCALDATMVNATTFPLIREDLAASLLAGLCGANRGLFVTEPGDGHVYGCAAFPPQWAPNHKVKHCAATGACACNTWDANAVVRQFDGGNLTATEAVHVYDQYVEAVYASTPGSSKDPRACGAGGFAALTGSECISTTDSYKAVTLRGIAGLDGAGHAVKMTPHTSEDYDAMKALGLNSVRVPVKAEDVASLDKIDMRVILAVYGDADVDLSDAALVECDASATKVRAAAAKAGVPVLLRVDSEEALRGYEGSDGVAYEISRLFSVSFFVPLTRRRRRGGSLEITPAVAARRSPLAAGRRRRTPSPRAPSVPPAADAATVVDVASSSPVEDRTKLFFHEATACASPASRFTHTKNGPGTIRCGFTDSSESAAQARRFT